MTTPADLTVLDDTAILAFAQEQDVAARRAECNKLLAFQHWAVLHPGEAVDPDQAKKPGREQAKLFGAAGNPLVAEFAPADLAARLRMSAFNGGRWMADSLDIRHRLPRLQELIESGEADVRFARHVAQQTRELSAEEALVVDEDVAGTTDGSLSWRRFEQVVAGAVANAAPAVIRAREQAKRKPYVGRLPRHEGNGMAAWVAYGDLGTISSIEGAVHGRAEQLEPLSPEETADERRLRALLELVTGASDVRSVMPRVHLHVHTYADSYGMPVIARVEGHGPVTMEWVRSTLGEKCRFTIMPVLDIEGQAPIDDYEIPSDHRRAIRMMTPADVFPFASCTSRQMDIDHTDPYRHPPDEPADTRSPPGDPPPREEQSRIGNYGPMTRLHHRIKTHSAWETRQPFPGLYVFRDPHGGFYVVDHTGTHVVAQDPRRRRIELAGFDVRRVVLDQRAA